MTIYKFQFPINDEFTLAMPDGATILHLELQGLFPCIWALVDECAESVPRQFRVFGTGWPVSGVGAHVGSFVQGPFVWHVFETEEKE
jgi:hypothetical protein